MTRAREAALFALLQLLALLALHRGALDGERLLVPFDLLSQYEPWASGVEPPAGGRPANAALSDQVTLHPWTPIAAERLVHGGSMTLWNPFQGCGTPLHANTLTAQLYPLMWLHALLPRQAALLAIGVLKGFLAGFFLFLFLRRRGASALAAGAVALLWPFSGFMAVWLGHQHTAVASLLPLLLYVVDRAADRPSGGNLAALALSSGATLLAGHMETALHVLLFAVAYALARAGGIVRLLQLAGAFLAGALLGMVQVLPFGEYSLYSQIIHVRHHPAYRFNTAWRDLAGTEWALAALSIALAAAAVALCAAAARARSLARAAAAAACGAGAVFLAFRLGMLDSLELLLDPDRHGGPVAGRHGAPYVGYWLWVEMNCGYASIALLPLAVAGLVLRPKGDRGALFFGAAALLALGVVFEWPLIAHAVAKAPLLGESKNKRIFLIAAFALFVLAAKGIDRLRATRDFGAVLIALAVAAASILLGRAAARPEFKVGLPAAPAPAETAASARAAAASGAAAGALFGLEAERAYRGPEIAFDGLALGRAPIAEVRVALANAAARADAVVALGEEADRARPLRATFAAGELPAGRYLVTATAIDATGASAPLRAGALWITRPRSSPWPFLFGAAALLALAAGALRPGLAAPVLALLVALAGCDLFRFADGQNPAVDPRWDFPETGALAYLRERADSAKPARLTGSASHVLPPNTATAYALRDTRGYDSVDVLRYAQFLAPLARAGAEAGATRATLDAASRMFDLLAVRWWLAPRGAPPPAPHFTLAYDGEIRVYENPRALPRAFVAPAAVAPAALARALGQSAIPPGLEPLALKEALSRGLLDPARTLVVEPDADAAVALLDALPAPEPTPAAAGGATFLADDFDRVLLEVDAAADGFLFLADTWMPGWEAEVDGAAAPVLLAFHCFRAVPVPAGRHQVEFRYAPRSVRFGLLASGAGLAIAALLLVVPLALRQRRKR